MTSRRSRRAPATGIAYLQLVAGTHHEQVAADERIGFHALYSTGQPAPPETGQPGIGQLPGQLSFRLGQLRPPHLGDDRVLGRRHEDRGVC